MLWRSWCGTGVSLSSLLLLFGSATAAHAQEPMVGTLQTLVACPVYRDTDMGRKSGCWLADDEGSGVRYDITWAPIKPQLGHEVLVEGIVADEPDTCGGVVLKPVRVAVLPSTCEELKVPADEHPGRKSPPPVAVLAPTSVPRELPPPPYEEKTFHIYFEFNRDFLIYQHSEVVLEQVMLYAKASEAQRVRIEGFAATEAVIVSGRSFVEPASLAESRANMAAEALRRLSIPAETIEVVASSSPTATDFEDGQLPEPSKRRITITVTP